MASQAAYLKGPEHANLRSLAALLPAIPQPGRKDIMTLLRMQCTPTTHLWIRTKLPTWYTPFTDPSTNTTFYIADRIVPLLDTLIFSPIQCGFVSMLLRVTPYHDPSHLEEIRTQAIWKEVHSTGGPDRASVLDYTSIFGRSTSSIFHPLNRYSKSEPILSQEIRLAIHQWKISLSSTLLLPTVGHKTMGVETSRNYWTQNHISSSDLPYMPLITPESLERMYMDTGCTTSGPVEVRVAFKFTDLKPRVYYAMGATSYFASRYIHTISDKFQRLFPSTHPLFRYMPQRIEPLDDDDILFVYDYTSFTSNLAELKYFLDALSSFCDDTDVTILDTHDGLISVNLGSLLREYNSTINVDAEFDIGPLLQMGIPCILHSAKSGLLGVHGNIVWSLSIHGVNLMHLVGGKDNCNCVGDDAEGKIKRMRGKEAQTMLVAGVRELGEISEEKMCWWTKDSGEPNRHGYHYVKRPLDRIDNHIWTKPMIDFPSLSLVEDLASVYHTVPFDTLVKRKRKFIVQTCRFLDSINGLFSHYRTEYDTPLILGYLRHCYRRLAIPMDGVVPGLWNGKDGHHYQDLAVPVLHEASLIDWRQVLWDNYGSLVGLMQFPVCTELSDLSLGFMEGDELNLQSCAIVSLLERVGCLTRLRRRTELVFNPNLPYSIFCALLDNDLPTSYVYLCNRTSPFWVVDYFDNKMRG